jgi:hexokinase
METTNDGDATLLALSKEIDAPDTIGKPIGSPLRLALSRLGVAPPPRIAPINDTAATLLAGIAAAAGAAGAQESTVGFILGTGFNTATLETAIPKINCNSTEKAQIVVHESGAFSNPHRGILDLELDAATKTPGAFTMEKACAGAYLGPLIHHILRQAIRDKLLCFRRADTLLALKNLPTKELNEFLCNPGNRAGLPGSLFDHDEEDAVDTVLTLAAIVSERAAILSACALAGIASHTRSGHNPRAPLRIAVEGTTYQRFYRLRPALESRLHTLLSAHSPRHHIIAPVPHASLHGAAYSAIF